MWESIRLLTFGRVRGIAIMRSFRKELDMVNGARQPLVLAFKEFVLDKSHGLENGKKIITRVISARIKCDSIFSTTIFFYPNENRTSASHCCIHTNTLFLIIFLGTVQSVHAPYRIVRLSRVTRPVNRPGAPPKWPIVRVCRSNEAENVTSADKNLATLNRP